MQGSVFDQLSTLLTHRQVEFRVLRHEPVFTSEEAARIRGATLSSGAKALICKADERFVMIVVPADLRLASKRVRKNDALRRLRFARREEVEQLTSLEPGAIPPFGSLFDLPTWCDLRLAQETTINFNAGDHAISINMAYQDYIRVEQPRLGDFGEPPG